MSDINYRNAHINHLDLSRLFALKGDYEKSINHRIASASFIVNPKKDGPWFWHHYGTIAFLEDDQEKLKQYLDKPWSKYGNFYEDLLKDLMSLNNNFHKKYRTATIFTY